MIKFLRLLAISIILPIGFVSLSYASIDSKAKGQKNDVTSLQVKYYDFYETVKAVGQCKSEQSKAYIAKLAGVVDSISISEGKNVAAGDVLITIDGKIAEANKAKAEAALESAQSAYDLNMSLSKKDIISKQTINASKVALQNAKLDLANAMNQYDNMIIRAPFDGHIGVVMASIGDNVKANDYLFSLVAKGDKTIFLELPENTARKIDNDSEIFLIDYDENKVNGSILTISDYLNDSGTLTAKISFPQIANILHGSYVEVSIIFDKHKGLGVLEKTVMKNNKGNFVYKITPENQVKQIYVKTATRTGEMIEIISDEIKDGDMIVLDGLTKVHDNDFVEIIKE